jgi:L-ascorbate metabolism protein UlaG (beta-lactamase superfamily)
MNNKKIRKINLLLSITVSLNIGLFSQEKMQYWDNPEGLLQEQSGLIFKQAYKILDAYPPEMVVSDERKLALLSIDALLHDTRIDESPSLMLYMEDAVRRTIRLLDQKKTDNGIRFFRLYNHGFIIQTPSITVGIDLVRGGSSERPFLKDSLAQALVDRCDILLISHEHNDHADLIVAQMFCEQKKIVIVPFEFWGNISPYIRQLRDSSLIKETIYLQEEKKQLTLYVYPGHQDNVLNNMYAIITSEGKIVMHTGDQMNQHDLEWIVNIRNELHVDVLLAHCWMMPLKKILDGINPGLVICGHENEMQHPINHREPYWLSYRRMDDVAFPYILMAPGEMYSLY